VRRDQTRAKLFTRRALLLGGGQMVLLAVLGGRLYHLQVIESDQYKMLAEENRISMRLLPAPRGRIFDRHGVELANNQQNFRVVIVPEQTHSVEETLSALADIIPLETIDRDKVLREVRRNRPFVPVSVTDNLSWDQFASVNLLSPELAGVQPDASWSRFYPFGAAFGHVVGYVGAVAESDLTGDPLLQLPGFRIGKNGIEKTADLALRGRAGTSSVEVNAYGRVIRELARTEGTPGADTMLTIDAELQLFAHTRFGSESGAAVVMEVATGEVLALVSTPGFDPNSFNLGIGREEWGTLVADSKAPLTNRAIAGQYPPGSTFKMMVGLAGLGSGAIGAGHRVFCGGSTQLGRHTFHCWKRGGHGWLDLVEAYERSCDVYFYDVARRTGIDRFAETAVLFGLGAPTGLELPSEGKGLIPTRTWKEATRGEIWHPGETLVAGIGQGYVLTTPLQLAVMTARIANGGRRVTPRLIRHLAGGHEDAEAPAAIGIPAAHLDLIREGMTRVSNSRRGTAYASRITIPEFAMAGKTGTSQVRRISKAERLTGVRRSEDLPWIQRDHALFVGYAPVAVPKYAVAVVVEHGGGGSKAAAPIARDILTEVQRRERDRVRFPTGPTGAPLELRRA